MTAPAVLRRWNDPSPVRVGRSGPGSAVGGAEVRTPGGAASAQMAAALGRMRRMAPLGAVLLTGLVAHVAVVPHLAVRGAAPDVLLVAVVAVAVARGSRAGAGFGFAAGLGADVFLATPVGTSALAYTLVGHVLGGSSRPRPARSASALCRPGFACFSCRTGRHHTAASTEQLPPDVAGRPSRARRRAVARRAALRRSIAMTVVGVGAGRLAVAVVATSFGGAAFPGGPGLVRMAGVALLSAPLGPAAAALTRRLTAGRGDPA